MQMFRIDRSIIIHTLTIFIIMTMTMMFPSRNSRSNSRPGLNSVFTQWLLLPPSLPAARFFIYQQHYSDQVDYKSSSPTNPLFLK